MRKNLVANFEQFREVFLGEQYGIALGQARPRDLRVMFTVITKIDEVWLVFQTGQASSYQLADLCYQLQAAIGWCETNCEGSCVQGWEFRK